MRTSKLTVTMLFVASMAWANAAYAQEPCGAPADTFTSCEIVQAPDCYDLCEPGAMVVACVAENTDQCMAECAGPGSIACDSSCEQECGNTCAAALVQEEPQDCAISCGSSCMGECGAACEASDDKVGCFAACGQQCSAHCKLSCDGGALYIDSGNNNIQENWNNNDDDDDHHGWRDDDDDHKKKKKKWRDDDDDHHHNDDDDDWHSQAPAVEGLGYDQGPAALVEEDPQDCVISCGASCMGECGAGCEASDDKVGCFANCGQKCDAQCEVSCNGDPQMIDSGNDSYQENWNNNDDDDDHHGWRDDDDDDHKKKWRDDDDDHHHNDDDDDWHSQTPVVNGLDFEQGPQESRQVVDDITSECQQSCQQSCSGACAAGNARACELGCQTDTLNVCKPQMTSACTDQCDRGAVLLCDGQYLNVENVDACVVALEQVGVPVEGPITAFNGDEVLTDALQGASCSVEEPKNVRFAGGLFALLGLGLGATFLRRRRS